MLSRSQHITITTNLEYSDLDCLNIKILPTSSRLPDMIRKLGLIRVFIRLQWYQGEKK